MIDLIILSIFDIIRSHCSIDNWSQEIYDIAKTYVSRDRKLAIDTAKMVPPQASIYSQVQTAMLEWKK
jgi:hypothetical protein